MKRDLIGRLPSIADAVSLMMRSDWHRHTPPADLERLLLPALMLDQAASFYGYRNRNGRNEQAALMPHGNSLEVSCQQNSAVHDCN